MADHPVIHFRIRSVNIARYWGKGSFQEVKRARSREVTREVKRERERGEPNSTQKPDP
jgi:hypothetical protein